MQLRPCALLVAGARHGGGGTCLGDSGGTAFLNGHLVSDTSYGSTTNCRFLGGYQRVDVESIQTWPATFECLGS